MASAGFTLKFNDAKFDDEYLIGLLNSKLLFWYLNQISNKFRGGWITCTKQYIEKLPIKKAGNSRPEKQAHDKIVGYVEKLLELNKSAEPDQKQIQHYENQIDKLVYELYGLTEDEIKIIEEATSGNS
jgi:predicted KAP-like P-loop ATPase